MVKSHLAIIMSFSLISCGADSFDERCGLDISISGNKMSSVKIEFKNTTSSSYFIHSANLCLRSFIFDDLFVIKDMNDKKISLATEFPIGIKSNETRGFRELKSNLEISCTLDLSKLYKFPINPAYSVVSVQYQAVNPVFEDQKRCTMKSNKLKVYLGKLGSESIKSH